MSEQTPYKTPDNLLGGPPSSEATSEQPLTVVLVGERARNGASSVARFHLRISFSSDGVAFAHLRSQKAQNSPEYNCTFWLRCSDTPAPLPLHHRKN